MIRKFTLQSFILRLLLPATPVRITHRGARVVVSPPVPPVINRIASCQRLSNNFDSYLFLYRYPVLLAMTFLQCCILSSGFIEGEFIVTMVSNAALKGYIFRNISTGAVNDCLKHCLADCLCQSFQICHGVCQLSSSSRHLMASSMRDISGCSYYDFESNRSTQRPS